MVFKSTVNKEKAILLKKLGWDYNDISEELGCSRVWCSLNLKEVKKDKDLMRRAMLGVEYVETYRGSDRFTLDIEDELGDFDDEEYTSDLQSTKSEIKYILEKRENSDWIGND